MSRRDLQLCHGPVGVLPIMYQATPNMYPPGSILSGVTTIESDAIRLRRRLETYRQRHEANIRNYDVWTTAMVDSQRQQTAVLFQRWIDSRCKKTASKARSTKDESVKVDAFAKSVVPKTKRRHTDSGASVCTSEYVQLVGRPASDNGSVASVPKHRKITDKSDSLCSIIPVLDETPSLVTASETITAGRCKQEGILNVPDVISSDMDFGSFDDDPSRFMDILKTITSNGCEFPFEFQKFLNESERDGDGNLNFISGDLTCLSASDVNDAVTAQQQVVSNNVQPTPLSFQSHEPLQGEMKSAEIPWSVQTMPSDSYEMQLWHHDVQHSDPLMRHYQLLPSCSTYECDRFPDIPSHHQAVQMPHVARHMQSRDANSLSILQRPQLHTWRPSQYELSAARVGWQEQRWQTPSNRVFNVPSCSRLVKQESAMRASSMDDAGPAPDQRPTLSTLSDHDSLLLSDYIDAATATVNKSQMGLCAGYQPTLPDCSYSQRLALAGFASEFPSSTNVVLSREAASHMYCYATEMDASVACSAVPGDTFASVSDCSVAHYVIEPEHIPNISESAGTYITK